MKQARRFLLLAGDALHDALRNRVGLFAIVCALLVGVFADRCTGFDGGAIVVNGREFDVHEGARLLGPTIYGICGLLLVLVSGFLAADALARPISERTAAMWLARPVGRAAYALARLAGALGLGLGAGIAVLGLVSVLLHVRLGLSLGPALVGIAVFAVEAWVVAAIAMALALHLPRVAALAAVVIGMQLVVFSNVLHALASTRSGLLETVERWGPPLGTAFVYAVAPWFSAAASASEWIEVVVRLVAWGAGASALLVLGFRRMDLPS
jgi:hypothetical protein